MRSSIPLRLALVAALLIVAGCGSSSDDEGQRGPNIFISSPSDGDTVEGMVMITVGVAGSSSTITEVEFFLNDVSMGTDDSAPFTMPWDTTAGDDGGYTIRAEGTDVNDEVDVTDVDVTVDNLDRHTEYFRANAYEGTFADPQAGTAQCLMCHSDEGDDILASGHWNWLGTSEGIEGRETEVHGKLDILNNFCVAVPQNEGRCTMCHIGYGWVDDGFDFGDAENIDCLCCHDQTGKYVKAKFPGGVPDSTKMTQDDLQAAAESVGMNDGVPTRKACLFCHAVAGGGDNVKHGDLRKSLADTTRDFDVHMGTDGAANYTCTDCHESDGSHGIGGMPFHSLDEGNMKQCTDCHGSLQDIHEGTTVWNSILTDARHEGKMACQVCHIPAFSRDTNYPTKVDWDWSKAGPENKPDPIPEYAPGYPEWNQMKGEFVFDVNVTPTLRYFKPGAGAWRKKLIGVDDMVPAASFLPYEADPADDVRAVLAEPAADYETAGAMIYTFKKMTGRQPGDTVNNRILVPHLWGTITGPNPYWIAYDWHLSFLDSNAFVPNTDYDNNPNVAFPMGQTLFEGYAYSGTGTGEMGDPRVETFGWVKTVMYLAVNHEVAPASEALGRTGSCSDCHGKFDFTELGYDRDPLTGGTRPD